ncbi:TMEM175 family protein [Companilactobacillus keshanensis]|uniref:TMEM175 family protein n=1 Tax=Companilactobacillus keshanensis TaxID=2486003 RepID=A0ABW4BSY5_9LACO|nr:TMEM175 family protein [Companilactobacillus keshanensis]
MLKKERFEAFTDAVIAIILTILVLELKLPENNHSIQALIDIIPRFAAYIMTFIFIATMWVNHHFLFSQAKVINNQIIWINLCGFSLLHFYQPRLPG